MSNVKAWRKAFKQAVKDGRVTHRTSKNIGREYDIPEDMVAFWRQKKSYVNYDSELHKACASARVRMRASGIDGEVSAVAELRAYFGGVDVCTLCGNALEKDLSVDHDIPLAHGGTNDHHNLILVHRRCNLIKGDMDGRQYQELIWALEMSPYWDGEDIRALQARLIAGGARRFGS